ncbi:MAG: hypothetical protein DWQ06_14245 [Calditrichaeota bacterium]|nr:MAG: hypothetical protein DWQ06_14245 [Calditrichota bacterium]
MKVRRITVQNFRAFKEEISIDFCDSFGKPSNLFLISGPNTSGKTSILDAIQVICETSANRERPRLRKGLFFSAENFLNEKETISKISITVDLEDSEKNEINRLIEQNPRISAKCLLDESEETYEVSWEYPHSYSNNKIGTYFTPSIPSALSGRGYLKQALKVGEATTQLFEEIGGVCYFDPNKTLRETKPPNQNRYDKNKKFQQPKRPNDPIQNLANWLSKAFNNHSGWDKERFGISTWEHIQEIFNDICSPIELQGVENGKGANCVKFIREGEVYGLNHISSGELQILNFAVSLVMESSWNSVVLIDEIEQNLHPEWQLRMIEFLENDTRNNQYIVTTHTPYVVSKFLSDAHFSLGELDEWK